MFGITKFTAIINPPQSAILAIGAPIERVVSPDETQTTMTVTLSCDARAIEHPEAAEFLETFATIISEPALLA